MWSESFDETEFLHRKTNFDQLTIFAEFSREDYSYDSFISKAEMVFDRSSIPENYRELPKMIVEREFQPNRILTLTRPQRA